MTSPSQKAAATVTERSKSYGDPQESLQRIADFWNVKLGTRLNDKLTAKDVAQMMRLLKESRLVSDPCHEDSLVDLCGYADLQAII